MLEVLPEPLEPGAVVRDAYRLERVVGEGGMGVVWAARELATGRAVALKFLRDGHDADAKSRERFLREARAAMTIAHPHVAKVDAVLETDTGTPFLVMELLDGESLRSLLRRRRVLSPEVTARILLGVVDAVAAAHEHGIVHRDLKPENVFLVGGDDVRVLDFGIAKRITRGDDATATALTSTGAVLGTPVYMAPEQIFGDEDIDGRADVWSLGIVLYECLAGTRPTDADGFGPIVKKITTEPIESIERAAPDVPKVLARLAMRMLTRDRSGRPPLSEVRDVLAKVVAAIDAGTPIDDAAPATVRLPPRAAPAATVPTSAPAAAKKNADVRLAYALAAVGAFVGLALLGFIVRAVVLKATEPSSYVVEVDASIGPLPPMPSLSVAGPDWSEASKALRRAKDARDQRDGPSCLAHLDEHDAASPATERSDWPLSDAAETRAACLMLAGRCNEGKEHLRTRLATKRAGEALDDALERAVAADCEGSEVTPREDALRAVNRLTDRTGTAQECQAWHATLVALLPKVPRRGPTDPLAGVARDEGDVIAARCLARAGACTEANALLRARAKKGGGIDRDVFHATPCILEP